MGMLSGLMKAGVAKKIFDEARKPHNQAKAKRFVSSLQNKGKDKGTKGY